MKARSEIQLTNGRSVRIGSCPCDERGDKLRELYDSLDFNTAKMGEIQKKFTALALEAIALFCPADDPKGIDPKAALAGLDMDVCREIVAALWHPKGT